MKNKQNKGYVLSIEKDCIPDIEKDILLFAPPLFCLDNLVDNIKKNIDKSHKAELLELLMKITELSKSKGTKEALNGFNDYKPRNDWAKIYGGNKTYYSIRLKNNSAFRVCKSRMPVGHHQSGEVFQIHDLINEKN